MPTADQSGDLAPSTPRSARKALVRPWACPGLYHVVEARDGGLCRLRLPGGILSVDDAKRLAEAGTAARVSAIEITNRANLQLRGIPRGREAGLAAALAGSGLTPDDPASDRIRNIAASPMAGIDPDELIDVRPIAARLAQRLETLPGVRSLPVKFGVLLEGGGAASGYEGRCFDVVLSAVADGPEAMFALGLGETGQLSGWRLAVPAAHAAAAALAATALYLAMAGGDPGHRMAEVVMGMGREAFERRLVKERSFASRRIFLRSTPHRQGGLRLGILDQRQPELRTVAAQPALGRLTPLQLGLVADAAAQAGSLRLTPWRSILVTDVAVERAESLRRHLGGLGLIVEAGAALSQIVACSGSTGCRHGLSDTHADARTIAASVEAAGGPEGEDMVHLSGCIKGCADPGGTARTLVAIGRGTYRFEGVPCDLSAEEALRRAAAILRPAHSVAG